MSGYGTLIWNAFDASRLGEPQEETQLYALSTGYIASWGAPMVFHPLSFFGSNEVKFTFFGPKKVLPSLLKFFLGFF